MFFYPIFRITALLGTITKKIEKKYMYSWVFFLGNHLNFSQGQMIFVRESGEFGLSGVELNDSK